MNPGRPQQLSPTLQASHDKGPAVPRAPPLGPAAAGPAALSPPAAPVPCRERSGVRASPRAAEAAPGPGRSAPPQGRVPHSPAGPGSAGAASNSSRRRRRQRQLRAARAIVPRVGPAALGAGRALGLCSRAGACAAPHRPRAGPLRPPPAAPRTRGGRRGHRPLLGAAVASPCPRPPAAALEAAGVLCLHGSRCPKAAGPQGRGMARRGELYRSTAPWRALGLWHGIPLGTGRVRTQTAGPPTSLCVTRPHSKPAGDVSVLRLAQQHEAFSWLLDGTNVSECRPTRADSSNSFGLDVGTC